jgi:hypothetical protein
MKRIALATSLTLALTSLLPVPAQAANPQVTFETVDSYSLGYGLGPDQSTYGIELTGIVQGENTPRTIVTNMSPAYSDSEFIGRSCERMALLAQSKPGQYLLQVRYEATAPHYLLGCSLTRVTP